VFYKKEDSMQAQGVQKQIGRVHFLLNCFIVIGCSVNIVDKTPPTYGRRDDEIYKITVDVKPGMYVLKESIKVKAIVDGSSFDMAGDANLTFTVDYANPRCKELISYLIEVTYDYESGYGDAAGVVEKFPNEGESTFQLRVNRNLKITPQEVMIYADASTGTFPDDARELVTIANNSDHSISVSGIDVLPEERPSCGGGDSSGDNFKIVELITFPFNIASCDKYPFRIELKPTSRIQSCGILRIKTSVDTVDLRLSGKIFVFR
jgi:hypothetical protein